MENPIESRKRMVQERIEKSFNDGLNLNDEIEKGRHGIYEDNAENRRLNRVGQEYGHAAQQKEPIGKTAGADKTVDEHAAEASDKALERAAADKNAQPEVREAAQKELENRGGQEKKPVATAKESKSSGGGDDGGNSNKPSKEANNAKKNRISGIFENGADKDDSLFMTKNESYFKDVLNKNGFDSWDDFEEWGADGADDDWDKYNDIWKKCLNKIPADNFLNKPTGAAAGIVVNKTDDKSKTIDKIKKNAAESKEAVAAKNNRIKDIFENGANKDDSLFMTKNEEHFKDYLKKQGFDSWDDFEEFGADGADDDWEKYEKIWKTCLKKIPASKFLKKSIINDIDIADVDEAKEILKGIDAENEFFEKAVYADTPENRKLGRVGQEYHKKSRGEKKAEYKKEFKRVSGVADYIAEVAGSSKSKRDKKKIARKIMKVKQDKSLTMEEKRKKILALNKMLAKSEE